MSQKKLLHHSKSYFATWRDQRDFDWPSVGAASFDGETVELDPRIDISAMDRLAQSPWKTITLHQSYLKHKNNTTTTSCNLTKQKIFNLHYTKIIFYKK